eukprot:2950002-Prymnesium_polylepis.1
MEWVPLRWSFEAETEKLSVRSTCNEPGSMRRTPDTLLSGNAEPFASKQGLTDAVTSVQYQPKLRRGSSGASGSLDAD